MSHTVTLIAGDGIGEEIISATVSVIEATGVKIKWDRQLLGLAAIEKLATTKACTDIARAAFEFATAKARKKVTAVHKANILKLGDGLFLDCLRQVQKDFPKIEYDELLVDALCCKLVLDPAKFDILVM